MELYYRPVHELATFIEKKELTPGEVLEVFLHRIEEVEDRVQAFITLTEERALHDLKKIGPGKGPLQGIPIALKDNMSTEGIPTTCGSRSLEGYIPPFNATIATRLEEEGTLLLGKTNLDEFAMGSSTEASSFCTTYNPWDLDRVPGGSSGGSAAAVAAGEVPLAFGSDTGGSIRQPASFCGVVGMKPTYGSVSRYGLISYASSLDQVGPLTRDVEDMAIALQAICGHDPLDSTSIKREVPDFRKALHGGVKGLKIGIPKEFFMQGVEEEIKERVLKVIEELESLGAMAEEVSLPHTSYALPAYYLLAPAEASSNLARYDGVEYGYRTPEAESLLDFYQRTRREGFGEEVKRRIMLGTYALSSGYYDAYYLKALKVRRLIKEDFDRVFSKCHVLLAPTTPSTSFKVGEKTHDVLAMYMSDICTVPVNMAGLPALSLPCGFDREGLPIGLQIIGDAFSEETILQVAKTCEGLFPPIKYPQLERKVRP